MLRLLSSESKQAAADMDWYNLTVDFEKEGHSQLKRFSEVLSLRKYGKDYSQSAFDSDLYDRFLESTGVGLRDRLRREDQGDL